MKKIGIVTLNGEYNYGNRLQNFALQHVLKDLGFQAETLVFDTRAGKFKNLARLILGYAPPYIERFGYWRMLRQKGVIFTPFSTKKIQSRRFGSKKDVDSEYDYFITGSDQVWNPNYIQLDDTNFLSFASDSKRISYAASFGVESIPEAQYEFYKNNLLKMKHISVREQAGVNLVNEIAGRKATLLVDPTMLLTAKDWCVALGTKRPTEKDYVVIYTLRSLDSGIMKAIKKYAVRHGCEVYIIMGDFSSTGLDIPNPAEFVERIQYAKAVFTDSFHASVFSIIFHTPFIAFPRSDSKMESRLVTLLDRFDLGQAFYDSENTTMSRVLEDQNFDSVNKVLAAGRKHGRKFLLESLAEHE